MADDKDLAAEVARLTEENKRLAADKGGAEVARLRAQLEARTVELAQTKGEVAAEKGPEAGTKVCYHKAGEPFHRPAEVLSDGWSARVPQPGNMFAYHCHLAVGEPPWIQHKDEDGKLYTPGHTFEVDRAYSPGNEVETFHHPAECLYKDDRKKGPYAQQAP